VSAGGNLVVNGWRHPKGRMNPLNRGISSRRPSVETRSVCGLTYSFAPSPIAGSRGEEGTTIARPTPTRGSECPPGPGGRRGRADSVLLSTPAALRTSPFGHHLAATLPTGPPPTEVTPWVRTMSSSNPAGWPLSMRSVAGPNAACRAVFLHQECRRRNHDISTAGTGRRRWSSAFRYLRRTEPHMLPPLSVNVQRLPARLCEPCSPERVKRAKAATLLLADAQTHSEEQLTRTPI